MLKASAQTAAVSDSRIAAGVAWTILTLVTAIGLMSLGDRWISPLPMIFPLTALFGAWLFIRTPGPALKARNVVLAVVIGIFVLTLVPTILGFPPLAWILSGFFVSVPFSRFVFLGALSFLEVIDSRKCRDGH